MAKRNGNNGYIANVVLVKAKDCKHSVRYDQPAADPEAPDYDPQEDAKRLTGIYIPRVCFEGEVPASVAIQIVAAE